MVGVTSAADPNNTVSYYVYDNLHRVQFIKDKDLNIVKKYDYSDIAYPVSYAPIWQTTGSAGCEEPLNGNVDRFEKDINPFSATFGQQRVVFDHTDCAQCQPNCGTDPSIRLINCVCTPGNKVLVSSTRVKVNNVFTWQCKYSYQWQGCNIIGTDVFSEYDSGGCPFTYCD